MKDIIAIYCGQLYFPREKMHEWDETNLETGGIGGSEVWAIKLAEQFEKKGYHCMVFADCHTWHFAECGVEYIPYKNFNICAKFNKFKCFISSRRVDEVNGACLQAETKILMFHDPFLIHEVDYSALARFDFYMCQSEYQYNLLIKNYPSLKGKTFATTFQAINIQDYDEALTKTNSMLWSSHKIRGSRFLIENVLPLIRKEVPDFVLNVCGYADDMNDYYFNNEGVNVLGNVDRDKLVELQKKSKIWIYPYTGLYENGNINDETFCITAIENAAAGNALIIPDKGCFHTTLSGYSDFLKCDYYTDDLLSVEYCDTFANDIAQKAIEYLKNEEKRTLAAQSAKNVVSKYTWENAADTFLNIINGNLKKRDKELILITGLIRTENVRTIFNSIKNELLNIDGLSVTWLICHDINKSTKIDDFLEELTEFSKNNDFDWIYYPLYVDKEEKHYGGEVFNKPLTDILDNVFTYSDPWVYILDDDNTISPLLSDYILDMLDTAETLDRKFILTHIQYEGGCIAAYNKEYFDFLSNAYKNFSYYLPWHEMIDPSQLIIKSSFLREIHMYPHGFDYDVELFNTLLLNNDKALTCSEYDKEFGWRLNSWHTTHNSIPSERSINSIRSIIESNDKKDFSICACNKKYGSNTIHVPEEAIKEIMNKYFPNEN